MMKGSAVRAVALGVFLSGGVASAQTAGTFHDIYQNVLEGCVSCHSTSGGNQNGGMQPGPDQNEWYKALVNTPSGEGEGMGKLRVHRYLPWNSFLLDKLSGDVKNNQQDPMTKGGPGYIFNCPGAIDEIYNWIVAGAPPIGVVPGDVDPGVIRCDKAQPAFVAPAKPAGGFQVAGTTFTVARPEREGEKATTASVGNAAAVMIGRIAIVASAGTEYVTVTRKGDAAPIAVARGQVDPRAPRAPGQPGLVRLDVALPQGVGVKLNPAQQLDIVQRVRNDYWIAGAEIYENKTVGQVVVNLTPAAQAATEAQPFVDHTGTDALFVPPRRLGTTGGAWLSDATSALVGIWTDSRASEAALIGAEASEVDPTRGYVEASGPVAYRCQHSNGLSHNVNGTVSNSAKVVTQIDIDKAEAPYSRPARYGCSESDNVPPGQPALVGDPAKDCYRSSVPSQNDCKGVGRQSCVEASLVGGYGVNDGRCELIGLAW
jgi:hypothetical protein